MATNVVSQCLLPHQTDALRGRTHQTLCRIVRQNLGTQYATQAPTLAAFRDALSKDGDEDAALLASFQAHVPLSDYDEYKPWIDKFHVRPCQEQDVADLLAPGLPDILLTSSATTGTNAKILPWYTHGAESEDLWLDPHREDPFAVVVSAISRELKVVERAGKVMHRIPVCCRSGGGLRRRVGIYMDEECDMASKLSGLAVPWAATRNVHGFFIPFATQFIDLMRHIDDQWDVLMSSIEQGVIPDLQGIDDVRGYLQAHFRADPERAAELREIGPPLSSPGWFPRVWPRVNPLLALCGGSIATVLPQVRSILGPNIPVVNFVYGSSEAMMGVFRGGSIDEFVIQTNDIIEFLDVEIDASHVNLRSAWDVQVGHRYEPIVTTRSGLWRYRIGDVLEIVGFDAQRASPVFTIVGRRASMSIRLPGRIQHITDVQLLAMVQAVQKDVCVHEFTAALDMRGLIAAVGFFVELAGPLTPNARGVPQRMWDALVAIDGLHASALSQGKCKLPTIRIVPRGTFAAYRRWKSAQADIASSQIKVPAVLLDPKAVAWFEERVVEEV